MEDQTVVTGDLEYWNPHVGQGYQALFMLVAI